MYWKKYMMLLLGGKTSEHDYLLSLLKQRLSDEKNYGLYLSKGHMIAPS